ncbi:hypothetical protein P3L10_014008 [Capsicum annuum]
MPAPPFLLGPRSLPLSTFIFSGRRWTEHHDSQLSDQRRHYLRRTSSPAADKPTIDRQSISSANNSGPVPPPG